MSFQIGTASNFLDLVQKIQTFLTATGHAWGKTFAGVGTGDLTGYIGTAATIAETWTITATSSTNFTVTGSVSGAQAAATVGTPYSNAFIAFTITAGGTAYVAGDTWQLSTSPKWPLTRPLNGTLTNDKAFSGGWTSASGPNLFNQTTASIASTPSGSLPQSAQIKTIVAVEVLEVSMTCSGGGNAPSAFTVDWSDNGSSWTTALTVTGATAGTWTGGVIRRFAVPASGAHLWWRLTFTASNGNPMNIGQADFHPIAGSSVSLANEKPYATIRVPGNDGLLQNCFVNLAAFDAPSVDTYGITLVPATAFDPMLSWSVQPGYAGIFASMAASNGAMAYWLTCNGRCFKLAVKVATTYHSAYFGLGLPYARPSAYPLPWFIGGSANSPLTRWSDTSATALHAYPRATGNGHAGVRDIGGTWRPVETHVSNASVAQAVARLYPNAVSAVGGVGPWLGYVRENLDGAYPLLPLIPCVIGVGAMMELDGAFWTTGFGTSAEAIIRQNRIDHVVIPNVFRTTPGDYYALRLD
jgi:hypothetical protein